VYMQYMVYNCVYYCDTHTPTCGCVEVVRCVVYHDAALTVCVLCVCVCIQSVLVYVYVLVYDASLANKEVIYVSMCITCVYD
jgi:hypothetical protein